MYHTEEENKHTQSPSLTHKHAFTHPVIALDTHQNWQGNWFLYLVTKKCILTSVNLLPLAPSDAKISWTETQTHKTVGRGSPFKAHSHPPLLPFHKIWTWGSALKRLHRGITKYRCCFVRGKNPNVCHFSAILLAKQWADKHTEQMWVWVNQMTYLWYYVLWGCLAYLDIFQSWVKTSLGIWIKTVHFSLWAKQFSVLPTYLECRKVKR